MCTQNQTRKEQNSFSVVLFETADYTAAIHYMEDIKSDLFGIVNNRKVYTGHWEIQEPTCEDLVKDFLVDLVSNWQSDEIDFDHIKNTLLKNNVRCIISKSHKFCQKNIIVKIRIELYEDSLYQKL